MKTQLFVPEIEAFAKNIQSIKEYVNREIYNTWWKSNLPD
jgi:hypothetical protein